MSVHIRFGASGKLRRLKPTRRQLGEERNATANFATASFTDHRIRASIRHALADEIDRLLNLIDALDDDPDLEPSGDEEPSLGWPNPMGERQDTHRSCAPYQYAGNGVDDRELDEAESRQDDAGDNREMDDDDEHSLGWGDFRATEGAFDPDPRFRRFISTRDEFDFDGKPVGEEREE
ncbi:hypothetical protein [Aureimonas psammosilenae]|uniref:hypothetical protein n=1 Tax=Aureimonas psammosilenae TaxID=2495496 RepID=UPI0012611543|nr:hypothetical protein [Aureimonas psammosilenae]